MSLLRLTRRLHLYLGMFLLPWMAMFGASAMLLNHPDWWPDTAETWRTTVEREYAIDVPTDGDMRPVGERIVRDLGHDPASGFGVYGLDGGDFGVAIPNFRHPVRAIYSAATGRLRVEERTFAWSAMLRDMHTHSGLWLRAPLQIAWTLTVDIVCVTILFWVASGLYMWWQLPGSRRLGWLVLATGMLSFSALITSL